MLEHLDGALEVQVIATIQSYVACALPFIRPKKAVLPKFLKLYLEEALTNSLTQNTAYRGLELLTAQVDAVAVPRPSAGADALTPVVDGEALKAWKSFAELTEFCDDFCDEFKTRVYFLAQQNTAPNYGF